MRTGVAIVVGIYFAILIGWGLFNFIKNFKKKDDNDERQYVGDRNYGFGPLLATLVAGWASNYTLLAAAESGFRSGISGPIWYAIGVGLPVILFVWPINLVERIRAAVPNGVTLIQFVEKRYDEKSRLASLVIILLSSILYIISVVMALGIVLVSLLNINIVTATLIGGIVLVVYTALGGIETIVWTHVYQLVLAGLSIIVALILTLNNVGMSTFINNLSPENRNFFGWGTLDMSDFLFTMIAFTIANPIIWQRIFSAKDGKSATRAIKWFGPTWAPFAVGSGLMGMAAFMLMPAIDPSQAATRLVMDLFPNWAAVLFLLGGMALIFSSGDAAINNVASIVQNDIIKKYSKKNLSPSTNLILSLVLQLGLGVLGILGALKFTSILDLLVINGALNISLLLPLYLGLTWKGATSAAAFWSIVISLLVGVFTLGYGPLSNLAVMLVSTFLFIGISYLSKKDEVGKGVSINA